MDWWPSAVPFDPEAGAAFHTIRELQEGVARLPGATALVAGRDARASGWAAKTALAIAESLGLHRRVLLVDMDFAYPRLHVAAGMPNDEGLSDIALFGASLAGVSRTIPGQPIDLVAAGAFVPDIDQAAASVPWKRLLAEAADSGASVLFYIPAERFTAEVSELLPDAVFLGGTKDAWEADRDWPPAGVVSLAVAPPVPSLHEPVEVPVAADALDVPAVESTDEAAAEPVESPAVEYAEEFAVEAVDEPADIAPEPEPVVADAAADEPAAEEPDVAPEDEPAAEVVPRPVEPEEVPSAEVDEEVREALIADLRARQHSNLDSDEPPVTEIDLTEPPPPPELDSPLEHIGEPTFAPSPAAAAPVEERPPHRRTMVVAGVAAGLVAVLAGAWHFRRSFLPDGEPRTEQSAAPAAAPEQAVAVPAGQPLAYSVAIEAHKHLPTAMARVRTLSMAQPRIGFYTTPILEDSVLWYRVMAGPVPDSIAAAGVLKELLASGLKTGGSNWDIHSTPLAFLIGVFDSREAAERRMSELQQIDIPSYVVDVPYTGGGDRYHLYAGAYAAAAEADVMREFLNSVGIPDSLVLRVGRAPS